MAIKDEILCSFLKHPMLTSKYAMQKSDMPSTVREALNSDIPIVKAIALIVDGLQSKPPITDTVLRNTVTQFLNEEI